MQIDRQREPRIAGWRRMVVVVDDPETSLRAIQSAVAAARRHQARLTIISVAPRPWATVAFSGMCPRRLEAETTECAATMVRRLAATVPADVPCTTVVRRGRMIKEVLAALAGCDHDLVFFALRPGGALGGGTSLRKAARLMRRASVDCVFLSSSPSRRLGPVRAARRRGQLRVRPPRLGTGLGVG